MTEETKLVVVATAAWVAWSIACGYAAHRLPRTRLEHDGWLLRARAWERGGRTYQRRFRIKAWKDRLPEAGALFPGGVSKRSARYDLVVLETLRRETRRAELAHWAMLALAPMFLLWIPVFGLSWQLAVGMFAVVVVANMPCVIVQRYNRVRLARILSPRPATM